MKRKRNLKIWILAGVYLLIAVGFGIVAAQDYSPTQRTVMDYSADQTVSGSKFSRDDNVAYPTVNITYSGMVLAIEQTQVWNQGADQLTFMQHYGGEYKYTLYNYNSFTISNWILTINFAEKILFTPEESWLCSATSTTDEESGKTSLTIKAIPHPSINEKDQTVIKPYSESSLNDLISFGMNLHTMKEYPEIESVTLVAVTTRSILDTPMFWVLVVALGITVFVTLLFIIVSFKEKQYQHRKEHDEKIIVQSINTFVNFIDAKDPYTKGHSARVAKYSAELAQKMGLPEEACRNLYYIALMHDVGKVSIPDSILQKPGKLDPDERKVIESHTTVGGQMLREFTAIPGIVSGALYHHERYDGTGYPHGLAGTEIPLFARIICVADSFDAMSSRRCYRTKLSYDKIMRELTTNAGKQFDPEIVKIMTDILTEAEEKGRLADYNL